MSKIWRIARVSLAVVAAALPFVLAPAFWQPSQAASNRDDISWLGHAAYFSEACRHEAEQLGIEGSADPKMLIAAFAHQQGIGAPDARAERLAGSYFTSSESSRCELPAISLINLLRLNGVAADLVLASSESSRLAPRARWSRIVEGVLVYVPVLDRYIDPAAPERLDGVSIDRAVKYETVRSHVIGPALVDDGPAGCPDICVVVLHPRDPFAVRVKTVRVHGP